MRTSLKQLAAPLEPARPPSPAPAPLSSFVPIRVIRGSLSPFALSRSPENGFVPRYAPFS